MKVRQIAMLMALALGTPAFGYDLQTTALPRINVLATPSGSSVTLVQDGAPTFAIVANKSKATTRTTVREGLLVLNEAFLHTTGTTPTLYYADENRASWATAGTIILLGDSSAAQELGFNADDLPDQGFLVSTFEKTIEVDSVERTIRGIALLGNETIKVGVEPTGGLSDHRTKPNAVSFAATDFCERFLDCRYYYPGEDGFYFPTVTDLTVAPVAYDAAPHFNTRGNPYAFYCAMNTEEKKAKWASYMGPATAEPDIKNRWRLGGTMELLGKHNPSPQPLGRALSNQVEQIFYRSPNGRLWYSDSNYWVNYFDVFNIGAGSFTEVMIDAWKNFYASGGTESLGGVLTLMGQEWINFGQADVYMEPPDCFADANVRAEGLITAEDVRRANEVDSRAILANVYGRFYLNMCTRLSAELPGKKLFALAYYNSKYAPTRYKLPSNFDCVVCDGSLLSYCMDPPARAKSRELFKGWYDAMDGRAPGMAYLYECSDAFGAGITPEYIGESANLLAPYLGTTAIFFDGTTNWHHFYGWYIGAHQQWDPDFDAVAAFDDMADKMFGAAAATMKQFHNKLRANCEKYIMTTLFDKTVVYPLTEVDALEALLAQALAAVADDELATRRVTLVAAPWAQIFADYRAKMASKTATEDAVYPVARKTGDSVDWSSIPSLAATNALKFVWDETGLHGSSTGEVHYTLSTDFKYPLADRTPLDRAPTAEPTTFDLPFTDGFRQSVYKGISIKPYGRLRLLGLGDDPNLDETGRLSEVPGFFSGDVTAMSDKTGLELTFANAKAGFTHQFKLIADNDETIRVTQSLLRGPTEAGFFVYAECLRITINGIPLGDVNIGATNLYSYSSGDRRGLEYALNFDGAHAKLRLFMQPKSSLLFGELEALSTGRPITNAVLRLAAIPSKYIRDAAAEPYPYRRQVRTATRLLERPSDAKTTNVSFDLSDEDCFFLAQDGNYDGTTDARGIGPCLMAVDMSRVEKGTATLGANRRDVVIECKLNSDFGKVLFGVWEDRVYRHSNEEIYSRFCEEASSFLSTAATDVKKTVDVPEGETLAQTTDIDAETAGDVLVKTGGGTWQVGANGKCVGKTTNFSRLEIRAGTVEMACSTGRFHPPHIVVSSGATLKQTSASSYNGNDVWIELAEGAVYDLNYTAPAFLSVTGKGLLKNPGGRFTADQLRGFRGKIYVDTGSIYGSGLTLADGEVHNLQDCINNFTEIEGAANVAKVTFDTATTPLRVTTPLTGGMTFTVKRPLDLARFDLQQTASVSLTGELTLSGGVGTLGQGNPCITVASGQTNVIRVTGGIHFGVYGADATFGNNGNSASRLAGFGHGLYTGTSSYLDWIVDGGQVYFGNHISRRLFLNGGRWWNSSPYSYPAGSEIHANGGRQCLKGDGSGQFDNGFTRGDRAIPYYVHEKGLTLQNIGQCATGWYKVGSLIQSGVTDGTDGGITVRGPGKIRFHVAPTITGPFRAEVSSLIIRDNEAADYRAAPYKFGLGDFELRNCYLESMAAGTYAVADAAGAKFRATGAGTLVVKFGSSVLSWTIGPEGATESPLARTKGGMLSVWTDGSTSSLDGTGPTVKVYGGVPLNDLGVTRDPIFQVRKYSGSQRYAELMTYDATKGFLPVSSESYAEGVTGGMSKLALVSAATTLSANAQVPALKIDNRNIYNTAADNVAPLVIGSGATLTVGDGVNPATVIFNAIGQAPSVKGEGTLAFGASEGVFALTYGSAYALARITGSGGLTIGSSVAGRESSSSGGELTLGANNAYTGGTYINNVDVIPTGSKSFSTGPVYVGEGYMGRGGAIRFTSPVTLANDIYASGRGGGGWGVDGALQFEADVTLTGSVALEDITYVRVPNRAHTATFAGHVYGDWLVVMNTSKNTTDSSTGKDTAFARDTNGFVVLTGANDISNEVQIVRSTLVLKGDSPSIGAAIVENDSGCLRFENTKPLAFPNAMYGSGVIQLANPQPVAFTDLLGQPGEKFTLDLACRYPAVNSLKGIGQITTSLTRPVYLSVLDDYPGSYTGTLPSNVKLYYGRHYKPGFAVVVH